MPRKKKARVKPKTSVRDGMYKDFEGRIVVTTDSGYSLECLAVGQQITQIGATKEGPKAPTYSYEDVSGATVTVEHTELSVKDPKTSDEERREWIMHLAQLKIHESEVMGMRAKYLALEGVRFWDKLPNDAIEKWLDKARDDYGMDVPDDPDEQYLFFMLTRVMRTPSDGLKIFAGVMRASGMAEEVLDQIEDTFRNPVADKPGGDVAPDTAETVEDVQETEG